MQAGSAPSAFRATPTQFLLKNWLSAATPPHVTLVLMPAPTPLDDLPAFRAALGAWFRENARDLPWRHTTDPYAIVVSEFMLQQTQVKTVLPYYRRWLAAFPTWGSLAAAGEEQVLAQWQGLGYYSRARALHKLAQVFCQRHPHGQFPRDLHEIRALPGVGPYTAGAISAFAFDLPVPAVDGNIARVLARLFDLEEDPGGTRGQRAIHARAQWILPTGLTGGREQVGGLMELGAVLCLARKPLCLLCPVSGFCAGLAQRGTAVEELPMKKPRPAVTERVQHAIWARDGKGEVLLQRAPGPLWRGMWHLPLLAAPPGEGGALVEISFGITRYKVRLRVHAAPADRAWEKGVIPFLLEPRAESVREMELCYFAPAKLAELPMPAPHRKALGQLLDLP